MPLCARLPLPFLAVLALIGASASAQMPPMQEGAAVSCAVPAALPDALAGWNEAAPLQAAGSIKEAGKAELTPGKASLVSLLPTPRVVYALRPEKPGGSVSFGGLAAFTVDQPGIWRVALSSGAWIDVVKGGAASTSIAHGHGPDCSGIRKIVWFDLPAGRHVVQIAGARDDSIRIMAADARANQPVD